MLRLALFFGTNLAVLVVLKVPNASGECTAREINVAAL